MSIPEDEVLRRVARGDTDAVEQFVGHWQPKISRVLSRLLRCRADSDDALQEVFLRVLRHAGRYQSNGSMAGWLYRIAINVARDTTRRNQRTMESIDTDPPEASANSGIEKCAQREQRLLIDQSLNAASRGDRELIVLKHFAGLTFAEIAGALDLPVTTVKSRMAAALKRLQITLQNHGLFRQELET